MLPTCGSGVTERHAYEREKLGRALGTNFSLYQKPPDLDNFHIDVDLTTVVTVAVAKLSFTLPLTLMTPAHRKLIKLTLASSHSPTADSQRRTSSASRRPKHFFRRHLACLQLGALQIDCLRIIRRRQLRYITRISNCIPLISRFMTPSCKAADVFFA
ncbi:unnamed protein product [Caenorhabditis auriculariae]|uniref:Uncharacterized protein n=1 Tax=Caenorhabditis auriculariae TaxID=2777116 RepID=A0A8S1H2X5_9PELO|nr:unnamed protein product [Caenorhabditis auriculariae]